MKDPMFLHEYIEQELASAHRYYKFTLADIADKAKKVEPYNLARDIAIELGYLDYEVTISIQQYSGMDLSMCLLKSDTIASGINMIMDVCDLLLSDTNYTLNTDDTKQDDAYYYIRYTNGKHAESIKLNVYIATSSHCKQVTTSRMEEVTKYVCEEEDS